MAAVREAFKKAVQDLTGEEPFPKDKSMRKEDNNAYGTLEECLASCLARGDGEEALLADGQCSCDRSRMDLKRDETLSQSVKERVVKKRQGESDDPLEHPREKKLASEADAGHSDADDSTPTPTSHSDDSNSVADDTILQDGTATVAPTATDTTLPSAAPTPSDTNADIPSSTIGNFAPSNTASPTNATEPSPPSQSGSSSGHQNGLSHSAKIGLGVGLGIGIPMLFALLALLFLRKRKKKTARQRAVRYMPQTQSDLSMLGVRQQPGGANAIRWPLHVEPIKHIHTETYQAWPPPSTPRAPMNNDGHESDLEDPFETPVSSRAPSGAHFTTWDSRPLSRHIPGGPLELVIPGPDATPFHSHEPSLDNATVSPESPVSAVSAVSPIGSHVSSVKQR